MNKEMITDKQAIFIIILFFSGTSSTLMLALSAEGDFWIAIILAVIAAMAMALLLIRLHVIFPQKNLFDICEVCFGTIIGKGICILYVWFVFEEGVQTLVNAKQFITTTTLPETPEMITITPLVILCFWVVREGIEIIGRWASFFVIIFMILIFTMIGLLIPQMEFYNIDPILYKGVEPVFKGTLSAFSFPFGEIIIFTTIFSNFKSKKSACKVYMLGLLISGIIVLATSFATILVSGIDVALNSYFPVYNVASIINVGNFIQRTELLAAIIGLFGAFLKISILLMATCKGISKIFNFADYRFLVIPVSLLMMNLAYILFDSRMDFVQFNSEIYPYYVFPFEVIFPVIIWVVAETRNKSLMRLQ